MTQSTKTHYLNMADDAIQYSETSCELQSVETTEPSPDREKDIQPPIDLLLERPTQWIAERCPFGERRQRENSAHRHNSDESESMNCLH